MSSQSSVRLRQCRSRWRSVSVAVGLGAAAATMLASCTSAAVNNSAGPALEHVSVVLDWSPNTNHSGLYLALARGYFADRGLEVEIVEPGETSGLDLVAAGQADFAYSVAESLVPARQAGAEVVSVATIIEKNTSSLISLTSAGIDRPRDLVGHSYGTYGSDLEGALIRTLVECDGGDPDGVTFAPLVSSDFRLGLTQNQYDVAWVFDAWDTIRLADVDGLEVSTIPFADYTACIPNWYTPLVATSAATISQNPQLVRDFLAGLSAGYDDAISHPNEAADALVSAVPELDATLVDLSADYLASRYAADSARWGHQEAETWDRFVAFLEDHGLIDDGFDTAAAWTDDYLPA